MDLKKAHAELAARCDGLSKKVTSLEDTQQNVQETIKSQAEYLEFLETVLRVEREASEAKINELTGEFQRERLQLHAKEQASAEIRKNIVQLLPKLAERRNGHTESEQDDFIARNNAA
jgi:DNA-directed RNA polymerase subunit F